MKVKIETENIKENPSKIYSFEEASKLEGLFQPLEFSITAFLLFLRNKSIIYIEPNTNHIGVPSQEHMWRDHLFTKVPSDKKINITIQN